MNSLDRRKFGLGSIGLTVACMLPNKAAADRTSPPPDDLCFKSATELSKLLGKREVKSEEVVRSVLKRLEAVNGADALNAVITHIPKDQILAEAKAADRRRESGLQRSRIDGVPCTIKDNIETADVRTTNGCPELKNYVPSRDATVVKRLKKAGAIILGKTNVPEMCMDGDTENSLFGRTRNPYDLRRIPGGSSGGEAAIIAAGGSPFGIGTDIGGSIRQPSHCCGIAGIKPTTGRVPDTGVFHSFHPSVWHWNGIGPMARSVQDLPLVLEVIAGPDGVDPKSFDIAMRNDRDVDIEELRVLVLTEDGYSKPSESVSRTIGQAASKLTDSCKAADKTVLPFFHEGFDRWVYSQVPSWGEAIKMFREEYAKLGNAEEIEQHHHQVEWLLRNNASWVKKFDTERRFEEQLRIHEFQKAMIGATRGYDIIVTPVNNDAASLPVTANVYENLVADDVEVFKAAGHFNHPFNILGWPAVVVRCGNSDGGLPIGLQVAAKPWREDQALAVAFYLEKTLGGWRPPDLM